MKQSLQQHKTSHVAHVHTHKIIDESNSEGVEVEKKQNMVYLIRFMWDADLCSEIRLFFSHMIPEWAMEIREALKWKFN